MFIFNLTFSIFLGKWNLAISHGIFHLNYLLFHFAPLIFSLVFSYFSGRWMWSSVRVLFLLTHWGGRVFSGHRSVLTLSRTAMEKCRNSSGLTATRGMFTSSVTLPMTFQISSVQIMCFDLFLVPVSAQWKCVFMLVSLF